ncbi:hypothetical protein F2Q70_00044344 [Brassica cretica]|uniref:Uncharacterized protein n=1 Tax=Brassica cretica TaxID=69181 RepID=A0A8S9KMH2_BRACR|nr:hypothetical protein F2Q70_00044344 [Brassica cretica]
MGELTAELPSPASSVLYFRTSASSPSSVVSTMETTIEASTTRVHANKPPSSGTFVDVESDEKQATTPDSRWPYLNRWSSNPLHEASAPAAPKLVPPHPPTGPMVETESSTSLTENGENEGPLDDLKIVAPLGDSGAPPTSSAVPPSVTHDQESSLVAAAHDSSSVSDIHNSSLVIAVHDSLATAVHNSLVTVVHDSLVTVVHDSLVAAVHESLGAWSKPLHFTPPPPQLGVSKAVQCQIDSFWPTIGEAIVNGPKTKKGQRLFPEQEKPHLLIKTILPPALKEDGSLRFPWAARMNQSSRNLFRATEPTYRLDAEKTAPIQSHIMESIPSHSIILEDSETSKIEQPIDPRSPLTLDRHNLHTEDTPPVYGKGNGFDVVGDSSSYTITRVGRTIKPTQKVQDMRWTKASGRGKKGHCGRGNQNH